MQNYKWFQNWFEHCERPEKLIFHKNKIFIDVECFSELMSELLKL